MHSSCNSVCHIYILFHYPYNNIFSCRRLSDSRELYESEQLKSLKAQVRELEDHVRYLSLYSLCKSEEFIPRLLSQKTSCEFNPFPSKPWFLRVFHKFCTCPLKTLRQKEKFLIMSKFSLSHSVFYLFREFCAIFIKFKIVVCKLNLEPRPVVSVSDSRPGGCEFDPQFR